MPKDISVRAVTVLHLILIDTLIAEGVIPRTAHATFNETLEGVIGAVAIADDDVGGFLKAVSEEIRKIGPRYPSSLN